MSHDFSGLQLKASSAFTPSTPVSTRQLLAGRVRQLMKTLDALRTPGQHPILYGERGVGKTSLTRVAADLLESDRGVTVQDNCTGDDTYATLWRRAFERVRWESSRPLVGFGNAQRKTLETLAGQLPDRVTPAAITRVLRDMRVPIVFMFDEFDQVRDTAARRGMAETIKALSDYDVPTKIVIIGVGDSVAQLLLSHESVERALVQVQMPRMDAAELSEIIKNGSGQLGMRWERAGCDQVVALAQGLPHYVHLIGLHSSRAALRRKAMTVTAEDVLEGIREAVEDAQQSLVDAYLAATNSPRPDSLFREVLLACALAEADERGSFPAGAVVDPLRRITARRLDVPAFARHLREFTKAERGQVLVKEGVERKFRYRFRNPLFQPHVVLRGIIQGLIAPRDLVEASRKSGHSERDG